MLFPTDEIKFGCYSDLKMSFLQQRPTSCFALCYKKYKTQKKQQEICSFDLENLPVSPPKNN